MNADDEFDQTEIDIDLAFLAEASIVKTIMSAFDENVGVEFSDRGLRFIRHLMATSRACRSGFLPNFSDVECARSIARDFIRKSGNSLLALQQMHQIV